jgi:2-polyprenyl-3-methyl-5-hydroxy-6-metoxy-1,4-benzoquinol methylase
MGSDPPYPSLFPEASLQDLRAGLLRDVPRSPIGDPLVWRYRENYGLGPSVPLTERMVLEHWRLERDLTLRLLAAPAATRAETFQTAYATLYASLPWLNAGDDEPQSWEDVLAADLLALLGPSVRRVLELGSGRGRLARRLAQAGHRVKASDLSAERRPAWAEGTLDWTMLDAVRPDATEESGAYDIVLSNQMIEHLHPEDLATHFSAVRRLLGPGGRYVFTTPHACFGPADLSRIFGADRTWGMHLREYTVRELARVARAAGFTGVTAGFRPPLKVARLVRAEARMRESALYRGYLEFAERVVALAPAGATRRRIARAARLVMFRETPLVAHAAAPAPDRADRS